MEPCHQVHRVQSSMGAEDVSSFITVFVMIFATSIAITKDLPDVKGDIQFNIRTFATKVGVKSIAFLGMRP